MNLTYTSNKPACPATEGATVFSLKSFTFEVQGEKGMEAYYVQLGQRGVVVTVGDDVVIVRFEGVPATCWMDPWTEISLNKFLWGRFKIIEEMC